jgi:hypothetical protein
MRKPGPQYQKEKEMPVMHDLSVTVRRREALIGRSCYARGGFGLARYHRIRSHREQVQANIANKLKPSTERKDTASVSQEKAVEGASPRLALAAMLTRRLTLRYSAEFDSIHAGEAALDVSKILPDYDAEERATLLERPLFGFASYGRVRFHHRSVMEDLALRPPQYCNPLT